jgi:RHS repeat-associated protein
VQLVPNGIVRREADPWLRSRFVVSDALGRVVQVLEPAGATWSSTVYNYDARSNLVSIYSDMNRAGSAVAGRRFNYDGLSRLTHRYLIERAPRLNDAGALSSSGTWSDFYLYDGQSNLIRHTDPRGVVVTYDYGADPLRRLQAMRVDSPQPTGAGPVVAPSPQVSFRYRNSGNPMLLEAEVAAGILEKRYKYDANSRLNLVTTTFTDKQRFPVTQKVVRNALGQKQSYSVGLTGRPELLVQFSYDEAGRRTSIADTQLGQGAFHVGAILRAGGELERLDFSSNGWQAVETLSANAGFDRVAQQTITAGGRPVADLSYAYDPASAAAALGQLSPTLLDRAASGQLLAVKDNIQGQANSYQYDLLGRLVGVASGPVGPGRRFSETGLDYVYDLAGNRTGSSAWSRSLRPGPLNGSFGSQQLDSSAADGIADLAVNALTNRIQAPGFEYDAAGNVVRLPRKDGTALLLKYDGLNRLVRVENDRTGVWEEYSYAFGNRRVISRSSSRPPRYVVWSGSASAVDLEEVQPTNSLDLVSATFDLAGRQVVRVKGPLASRSVEFLHSTPVGNYSTGPSLRGAVMGATSPFGTTDASQGAGGGYHSYGRSPLGLDYAVNRFYDPEIGRFIQVDPLGESVYRALDPQSLNLYAFNRNDPVNLRDPLGLDSCDEGGLPQALPDGGLWCSYPYGKTVYETVVRAQRGDSSAADPWISKGWGWAPWQSSQSDYEQAVDQGLLDQLRKLRKDREEKPCNEAKAAFYSAANAYAETGYNLTQHNLQSKILQAQAVELAADTIENVSEQSEDSSLVQGGAALVGRNAGFRQARLQYESLQIQRAHYLRQQKDALNSLKTVSEARDKACQ